MLKQNQDYSGRGFFKELLGILLILLLFSSCGGRTANPIQVTKVSDGNLSCIQLTNEINYIDQEVRKLTKVADKQPKNVALLTAGAFLVVPYFFVDLQEAEKQEINALRARYFHLTRLAKNQNCAGYGSNSQEMNLEKLLKNIDSLLEKGIITAEEHQTKRKEVIRQFNFEN